MQIESYGKDLDPPTPVSDGLIALIKGKGFLEIIKNTADVVRICGIVRVR